MISSDDDNKNDEKAQKKKSEEDRKKKPEKKKQSVAKSSSDLHAFLDIPTSDDEDKTSKTPKSPPTAKKPKIRYKHIIGLCMCRKELWKSGISGNA